MKTYRDLDIYKDSKRLAVEVHGTTLKFPKFELYEEGSQLRRSSKSISTMLVEGFARRRYKADYIKYLVYAQAECDETLFHLEIVHETKSMTEKNTYGYFKQGYESLGKRLNSFIQWTERNYNYNQNPDPLETRH